MHNAGLGEMRRTCRDPLTPPWRRRRFALTDVFRHLSIVTDPKALAHLNSEVEKRTRAEQLEFKRTRT
jgi:hypothetical protein